MRMQSVMKHTFSQVPSAEIQRSSFDRSHGYKTTFDAGWLVPIFVDEVLPGDTFNLRMHGFARMATPIFPVMDNMFMESFYFFVPYRLLWSNWERFNGAQTDPGDSTDYVVPSFAIDSIVSSTGGGIFDYYGLPLGTVNTVPLEVSALPFRAYNLIWNEWFRDQNLQDSVTVNLGDSDSYSNYTLLRRGKRHDYFTSCLPWPQKGDSVDLPLGTSAPITGIGVRTTTNFATGPVTVEETGGGTTAYPYYVDFNTGTAGTMLGTAAGTAGEPAIYADLTAATAATINQLRQAFQVQRLYERDARGGTRYTEILRAHFGVISPDARLQRPEFLGGGSSPVNIAPVAQTSSTDATTPQGNLSAFGTVQLNGHGFTKSFTEHGVIIGLVNVRADLTYQQGLNRMFSRQTRFDFFWPALAHIGEQAVLNKEIYAQGTAADDEVFGYQERYAEYRYKPSQITGAFRSNFPSGSLDAWHLSQDFGSLPVLDSAFIVDSPPVDRVIAVDTEPHFLFDSFSQLWCARPMPVFGVPGLIDHF